MVHAFLSPSAIAIQARHTHTHIYTARLAASAITNAEQQCLYDRVCGLRYFLVIIAPRRRTAELYTQSYGGYSQRRAALLWCRADITLSAMYARIYFIYTERGNNNIGSPYIIFNAAFSMEIYILTAVYNSDKITRLPGTMKRRSFFVSFGMLIIWATTDAADIQDVAYSIGNITRMYIILLLLRLGLYVQINNKQVLQKNFDIDDFMRLSSKSYVAIRFYLSYTRHASFSDMMIRISNSRQLVKLIDRRKAIIIDRSPMNIICPDQRTSFKIINSCKTRHSKQRDKYNYIINYTIYSEMCVAHP